MSIDERIVQMEFDNRQFEKGAEESMRTLERLKNSLNLQESVDNLVGLQTAGNNFSLRGMGDGIQEFKASFSALGVVGFTVIQNLTNSAINAGKRIAGAITDPLIRQGSSRALNIEQAMFQFEGLGMNVEQAMESALGAVTDTSYGLDEAAMAAAQFGASGMQAGEEMTTALRAISGVAAMTGSEYSDISRVFINVAGNGRLMGNELLRLSTRGINAAATLADTFGITEQAVREMVTRGEISFEMFYQAMDNAFGEHATKANETYAGSLANVKAALAMIGQSIAAGYFENMRHVFNALRPAIHDVRKEIEPLVDILTLLMEVASYMTVTAINTMRHEFSWLDGRMNSIIYAIDNAVRSLSYAFLFIIDVMKPIKDAFVTIFPRIAGERIEALSDGFRRFFETLRVNETTADNIRRTFMGIFSAIDIGIMIAESVVRVMLGILGVSAPMGEGLLFISAALGDIVTRMRNFLRSSGVFQKVVSGILAIITPVIRGIGASFRFLGQAIDHFMGADVEGVSGFFNRLAVRFEPVLNLLRMFGQGFWNVLERLKVLVPAFESIINFLSEAWSRLINALFGEDADLERNLDILNKMLTAGIFYSIIRFFTHVTETIETGGGFFTAIKRGMKGFLTTLKMYQALLSAQALIKIAIAIGILTASLIALSLIDPIKLTQALVALGTMFTLLTFILKSIGNLLGKSAKTFAQFAGIVGIIIALSIGIGILSGAVMMMAMLDWGQLARGVLGLAGVLTTLVGVSWMLKKSKAQMISGSMGLIALATSMFILSRVVKELGEMEWEVMTQGLLGVMGMVLAVGGAMFLMAKGGKLGFMQMLGIRSLAASLVIFQKVIEKFGEMDADKMQQGLLAMAYTLVMLSGAVAIMNAQAGGATAMLKVAGAMALLTGAIFILGGLPFKVVSEGLTVLGLTLGVLALGLYAIGKAGVTAVPSMIGLAGAILLLTPSLLLLGTMSREGVASALTALGGSLIALAGGIWMLGNLGAKGAAGAGVLALAALALMLLIPTLVAFAMIPSDKIGQSLGILAFSLTAMSIALHYMEGSLKGAGALAIVAASLMLLIIPLKAFGDMEIDEIGRSLLVLVVSLGALTGVMAVLTKLAKTNPASILSSLAVFPVVALSLMLIGNTLQEFSKMSWGDIGRALTVLGVTFLGIILAILALGKLIVASMGVILAAIAVLPVIALSMMLMVAPLREFGDMDAVKIAKSLALIGVGLLPLAVGVTAMSVAIVGALALKVVSSSLLMLIPALKMLGQMGWLGTINNLALLSVTLIGFSAVTAILGLLSPLILAFGLALGTVSIALVGIAASAAIFINAIRSIQAITDHTGSITDTLISLMDAIESVFIRFLEYVRAIVPQIGRTVEVIFDTVGGLIEKYSPRIIKFITDLIRNLMTASRNLAPEFTDTAIVLIDNFMRGVETVYPRMVVAAINMILSLLQGLKEATPELMTAAVGTMLSFIIAWADAITENEDEIEEAAEKFVTAWYTAVKAAIKGSAKAAASIVKDFTDMINDSPVRIQTTPGISNPFVVRAGAAGHEIAKESGEAFAKEYNKEVEKYIFNLPKALRDPQLPSEEMEKDPGIGGALTKGATGGIQALKDWIRPLTDSLENKAEEFKDGGEGLGEGLEEGMSKGISDAFRKAVQKIEDDKFFGVIDSLEEELERWKDLMARFGEDDEARRRITREKFTLRNAIITKAYQDQLDKIDKLEFYEKLTAEQKLERLRKIHDSQEEGSERELEMARKVFTAEQEYMRDRYQNSRDWIRERQHYGELSLRQEIDAYDRMLDYLDPESKFEWERKAYRRVHQDRYTALQRMEKTEEEIQNRIQELYEDGYERRKQLEKEYRDEVAKTKDQLERDIEDVTRQYIDAIDSRADALYSTTGLFDEVRTVDEDVTSDDLLNNLQGQVDQFYYWRKMLEDLTARGLPSGLMDELTEMGPSSLHELRALGSMSEGELDRYVNLWETKHKQARQQSVKELEPLRIETEEEIERLTKQAGKDLETLNTNLANDLQAVTDTTLDSLRKTTMGWLDELGEIGTESEKAVIGLADTIRERIREDDWEGAAKSIPEGLSVGIKDNQKKAINAVKDMGLESLKTLKNVFDSRSPSREFHKIGAFCMEGFVNGLRSLAGSAVNTIIAIGELVKKTFIGSLSSIMDLVDMDDDYQPTIRPVLDLSDIRSGSRSLDSILDNNLLSSELKGVGLSGVGEFKKMTKSIKESLDRLVDIHKNNPPVHNHFDVSGITIREDADINRIARELYQLQIATDRG